MGITGNEHCTNCKCTKDRNILKGSCGVKNTSPKNPKLDFSSEFFDPLELLEAGNITLPFPNVRPYNNLSEYNSVVFKKMKRPRNSISKSDALLNSAASQSQPDSQEYDCSEELFKDKKEINKNKYKKSDVLRDVKRSSGDDNAAMRRKECNSSVGPIQEINESRIEKHSKKHSGAATPKNEKYDVGQHEKRSPNSKQQNARTPDSEKLCDTTKNNTAVENSNCRTPVHNISPTKDESSQPELGNHTGQRRRIPYSVFKERRSSKPNLEEPEKPVREIGSDTKCNDGSPALKNTSENDYRQTESRKKITEQREQRKQSSSVSELPEVIPDSLQSQESVPEVENHSKSYSDSAATKNRSYYSEKRKFKNGSEQKKQYSHFALKDRSFEGNSPELQGSLEGTGEGKIENFRKNCSSETSTRILMRDSLELQLSEENNETGINQSSGNFSSQNETNINDNCNRDKQKMKNVIPRSKHSPSVSDTTKLQGFAEESSKVERHGNTSLGKSPLNKDECCEHGHNEKRNLRSSAGRKEKRSGSRDGHLREPDLAEQHDDITEETNNQAIKKRKSIDGLASKNSAAQDVVHCTGKGNHENCAEEHQREADQDSRNVCVSQEPNSAELHHGKQSHKEKENVTDKNVKNHEETAANKSASEKFKHYKIPKRSSKNKSEDKRISERALVGRINEFGESSGTGSRKGQNEMTNVTKNRNIEENDVGEDVLHNRKYCNVKDQNGKWKKDNTISQMDVEKSENFRSSWVQKSRTSEKNINQYIEQQHGHRGEKSSMNVPVERHREKSFVNTSISDSSVHCESDRKYRDDKMLPEKDFAKYRESQHWPSRHRRDHHLHPAKHGGEHRDSSRTEGSQHCNSRCEETSHHKFKNDRTYHCHSGSENCHDHPKAGENCRDRSKSDHHGQCCSEHDESCRNLPRCESFYDCSRSDESHHDNLRYDRRHYDRREYNRYSDGYFRFAGRSRYHSRRGRRFRGHLEHDQYRQDYPRYDRNRHDHFRYGGIHPDSDFHHDMNGRPSSLEKHKGKDEKLPNQKEMKDRASNDCECCRSKHCKNRAVLKTGKKHENMLDQERMVNSIRNVTKNVVKKVLRLDYEDGELLSDSDNLMDFETTEFQPNEEESDGLIDKDEQIKTGEKWFEERKRKPNYHKKFRDFGNKHSVNEDEICSESELEISAQMSGHNTVHTQGHLEQNWMEESNKTQCASHNKKENEISKESKKDNVQSIHEQQCGSDVPKDHTGSVNAKNDTVTMPPKHGAGKTRQANLFDYKGFTLISASKTAVRDGSSNINRGTNQAPTEGSKATDDGSDYLGHTYHFDSQECSSSGQIVLESTPITQSSHKKINFRENFLDSSGVRNMSDEEGDQRDSENRDKTVMCQSRNLEQTGNQNSELYVQQSGNNQESNAVTETNRQEHFQVSDSDSSGNFSDEVSQESSDTLLHEVNKQNGEIVQPNQNWKSQGECTGVSNYDLFGTSSDDDDCVNKQDRNLKESHNNLNAELQNQNSCNSDLFGSISDDDSVDETTQIENLEERRESLKEQLRALYEESGTENHKSAEALGNSGTDGSSHSVNRDSDEDLKDDAGESEMTQGQRSVEECSEKQNGELQGQHVENCARNSDKEMRNCTSQDANVPCVDSIKNSEKVECIENSGAEKQHQLSVDNSHDNTSKVVNNENGEVAHLEAKQMNDRELIYQNIKLLTKNAARDCACKCHKHCRDTTNRPVAVINTYHDKSTQVNFDTDEHYDDCININIGHVKINFIGDHSFTEAYKKSILHDDMNTFVAKCHGTGVRKPTSDMEGKENVESEQVEECNKPLETNRGKRKRGNCDEAVAQETRNRNRGRNRQDDRDKKHSAVPEAHNFLPKA